MRTRALAIGAGVLIGVAMTTALSSALASTSTPAPATVKAVSARLSAGTPKHPQGVRLAATFGWQGLNEADQPTVVGLDIWFPKGSVYNGARYPRCSVRTLDAVGPGGCPKGSIMGSGTGTAFADTTITRPKITVVNGGGSTTYFYTVLNNPARVQEPVVGHITRVHGQFAYHLSATIPQNLRIVAGVPIKLTFLKLSAGKGRWLELTSPPSGVKVSTRFDNGARIGYQVTVQNS